MKWHYVYGAVWTTPLGPEDGGQCVAVRASKSNLEPTEKDAALRLMAAAPDLLAALQNLITAEENREKFPGFASAGNFVRAKEQARAAIARATSKD
jgi:hypothetical protein